MGFNVKQCKLNDFFCRVPKNLRIVVYCNALRYSDNVTRDFNFLWEKYTETNLMTEVITMYAGLACAEDIELLKW